jgi:hypothetical protein
LEADHQGCMHAAFRNGLRKPCKGLGDYYVRSDAFTCLQGPEEDNRTFNKKQIRWFLEQYRLLKEAAQSAQVRPFFAEINNIRQLSISAATAYGWFDLQVGQETFGALPQEDQAMLAGADPAPVDPLKDLMGGVLDIP